MKQKKRSCKWGGKGNEKLYVLERKKNKDIFVSIGSFFFCFLIGGYIYKYDGYFDPFNQLTWGVFKSVYIYLKTIENTKNSPSALHGI